MTPEQLGVVSILLAASLVLVIWAFIALSIHASRGHRRTTMKES